MTTQRVGRDEDAEMRQVHKGYIYLVWRSARAPAAVDRTLSAVKKKEV